MTSKEAIASFIYNTENNGYRYNLNLEELKQLKKDLEILEILNKYLVIEEDGYIELNGLCVPCKSIELNEFRNVSNDFDNVRDYLEQKRGIEWNI